MVSGKIYINFFIIYTSHFFKQLMASYIHYLPPMVTSFIGKPSISIKLQYKL